MSTAYILVVDDEPNLRRAVEMILQSAGYDVTLAASAAEAEKHLAERAFDLMLLDLVMPETDGLQFLHALKDLPHRPVVVMISGNATIPNAVAATRAGVYDFIEKPIAKEKLLLTVKNALAQHRLAEENARLRRELAAGFAMLGDSPALQRVREQIRRVAPTTTRVLILGESGTGKELAARALHEASERSRAAFIKVNCAAIPENLIESELFGHEKGAFTGATTPREGKFELADHGTLFLDEVGDMSLKVQAKVLRVLQEGEFERVGGSVTRRVDVRVIAATNKNLEEEVRRGRFREDLWYRLNVVPLVMPPLRERQSDIPLLIEHFVARFCQENGFKRKQVSPEAIAKLTQYPWPGNIRELKNAIERLVIMTPHETITPADLPLSLQTPQSGLRPAVPLGTSLDEVRKQAERDYIRACLQSVEGNVTRAAQWLGVERSHLYKKMKALGLHV